MRKSENLVKVASYTKSQQWKIRHYPTTMHVTKFLLGPWPRCKKRFTKFMQYTLPYYLYVSYSFVNVRSKGCMENVALKQYQYNLNCQCLISLVQLAVIAVLCEKKKLFSRAFKPYRY